MESYKLNIVEKGYIMQYLEKRNVPFEKTLLLAVFIIIIITSIDYFSEIPIWMELCRIILVFIIVLTSLIEAALNTQKGSLEFTNEGVTLQYAYINKRYYKPWHTISNIHYVKVESNRYTIYIDEIEILVSSSWEMMDIMTAISNKNGSAMEKWRYWSALKKHLAKQLNTNE